MLKRIITAIVALIVFFAVLFAGVIPFQIAVGLVILFMLHEVYGAMTKSAAVKGCGFLCSLILMAGMYFHITEIAVLAAIAGTMVFLVALHGKVDHRELFAAVFMTVYVTLFTGCIAIIRGKLGIAATGVLFIIAWGSDTAAYFCGTFLGKHKLIPRVSPKKTVEGSVGAVIIAALLCVLYAFIMQKCGHPLGGLAAKAGYMHFALIGAVCSAASQLGDLTASAVKRDTGIKDYGRIFPGHGGFMDRFDSVIFIAPIVYYFMSVIIF